jgi:hypothetical protein
MVFLLSVWQIEAFPTLVCRVGSVGTVILTTAKYHGLFSILFHALEIIEYSSKSF